MRESEKREDPFRHILLTEEVKLLTPPYNTLFRRRACDEIAKNAESISDLRRAGDQWGLLGVESGDRAR